MKSSAKNVSDYLSRLPEDRREAIEAVRNVVRQHLPEGFEEGIGYGMIGYTVPLSVYPDTYNGQPLLYAAIGSQKNHMAVYLMCAYGSKEIDAELRSAFQRAGKKLDMGKSCIRFKRLEEIALDAIGRAVGSCSLEQFIALDQAAHGKTAERAAKRKTRAKKPVKKPAKSTANRGASSAKLERAGRRTAPGKAAKRRVVAKKTSKR